jgi:hypothetical protein
LCLQTAVEALDDEALFGNENDEEEDGAFVMYDFLPWLSHIYGLKHHCRGGFTDAFGEDFLGLRELGIASEFGLSSLTIPKKLLKNKNKGRDELNATAYAPLSFSCVYILTFNPITASNPTNHLHHTHLHLRSYPSLQQWSTIKSVCSSRITKVDCQL